MKATPAAVTVRRKTSFDDFNINHEQKPSGKLSPSFPWRYKFESAW